MKRYHVTRVEDGYLQTLLETDNLDQYRNNPKWFVEECTLERCWDGHKQHRLYVKRPIVQKGQVIAYVDDTWESFCRGINNVYIALHDFDLETTRESDLVGAGHCESKEVINLPFEELG